MNEVTHVVDVSAENFQAEVVDKSRDTPVLLEFYAQGHPPSDELSPVLRRLAGEYQGKFVLARVDIQENQQVAQQLGVRTLPTLKVIFQGQMAENLEGPQEEAALRQVLDQLTSSPIERIRAQIDLYLSQGDRQSAVALLQQMIEQEPKNFALHAELSDLLIMEGRADEARQILAALPEDTEGLAKPKARLEFVELAGSLAPLAELDAAVEGDPDDLQSRFDLAIALVVSDNPEAALEQLLELLKRDRQWQDEAARKTMIKVFDMLGKGNELATSYRRKMFTFLH